ncbi:MAG: OmpA family protein [Gammaproteobacteria bacterium]|nr:OmpA family protein [Gammaproteobacteria bacterium]
MANGRPKCEDGLPPWMATFADLMSLLMCFFVLLLSFATIDAVRFKKMAESMQDAFGVQRKIPANEIVMGVSVIKQEWSPTVSEPSVITEIRQETSDAEQEHLKMHDAEEQQKLEEQQKQLQQEIDRQAAMEAAEQQLQDELAQQMDELQDALNQEIDQGLVTLERKESSIIVRIQEKGSFGSGSARLDPEFHEVMARISKVLAAKPGKITVAGHSDNIPISTGRFRSNWELSSARAVTVLHSMLRNQDIAEDRVVVEGFADTRPLVENDSPQNRARNRRVELILTRGIDEKIQDLNDLKLN